MSSSRNRRRRASPVSSAVSSTADVDAPPRSRAIALDHRRVLHRALPSRIARPRQSLARLSRLGVSRSRAVFAPSPRRPPLTARARPSRPRVDARAFPRVTDALAMSRDVPRVRRDAIGSRESPSIARTRAIPRRNSPPSRARARVSRLASRAPLRRPARARFAARFARVGRRVRRRASKRVAEFAEMTASFMHRMHKQYGVLLHNTVPYIRGA